MQKNLLKLYICFLIAFILTINIFPHLFVNLNNSLDYLKYKTIHPFKDNHNYEIPIYKEKANVIIMFDDGWETQYKIAYKYMHQKNMRGTIAVIPSHIDEDYYMSKGELGILYDHNWDLVNHTYNHKILNEIDVKDQIKEIKKGDEWLSKNGFNNQNDVLIYPEGEYNSDTVTIMKVLNYKSGRTVQDGFNTSNPNDIYNIKVKNILSMTKPEWVKSWIDYAIDYKLTIILLFHKIQDDIDDSQMKYKVNDFYQIINYIDSKRKNLNIITYSEWIEIINL